MADLSTLRDIQMPPDPHWWPPAPGWWLLLVLIVVLLIARSWLQRRMRSFAHRQQVLNEFRRIRRQLKTCDDPGVQARALSQLSILMRQVAHRQLKPAYRSTLTGQAWLSFLSETSIDTDFCKEPGLHLVRAPYASTSRLSSAQISKLMLQTKQWLGRHA